MNALPLRYDGTYPWLRNIRTFRKSPDTCPPGPGIPLVHIHYVFPGHPDLGEYISPEFVRTDTEQHADTVKGQGRVPAGFPVFHQPSENFITTRIIHDFFLQN